MYNQMENQAKVIWLTDVILTDAPLSDHEHQTLLPSHTTTQAKQAVLQRAPSVTSWTFSRHACETEHAPRCPPERASSTSTRGMNGMELSCTFGAPAHHLQVLAWKRFTLSSLHHVHRP